MKKTTTFYLVGLFILLTAGVWGQKIGYTNSADILRSLPQAKAADNQLQAFQESLVNTYEAKKRAYGDRFDEYYIIIQSGNYSAIQKQTMEQELKAEQDRLLKMEEELASQISEKQERLYAPIYQTLKDAIYQVAQENGFQIVLDLSVMNLILDADESLDITNLIKAKLRF